MGTRNRWCDCVRGYAILLVCFEHILHVRPIAAHVGFLSLYHKGDTGVFMFYVLSGFLVTAILVRETNQLGAADHSTLGKNRLKAIGHFFARRVFRLQPSLLLFVGLYLLLPKQDTALPIWALILPISNWYAGPYITWHLKTLHIEESYYLFIGWLSIATASLRPILWLILMAAPVGRALLFLAARTTHPSATWWLDRYPPLETFAAGGLLALYLDNLRKSFVWTRLLRTPRALFFLSLAALLACGCLRNVRPFSYLLIFTWPLLFSFFSACMIVSGLEADDFGPGPEWLRKVGVVSYTIYLFQQFALGPFEDTFKRSFTFPLWLLVVSAVVIGVPLWYRFVEMPLTNLGAATYPRVRSRKTADRGLTTIVGSASPGLPPVG
ncbi:MAG: hypothetical protein QOH88_3589 [Verrucomicrobiota bacterium]|jgi:peptidoglycan/LPS O-acetylase OafA/YrhL